MIFGVPIDFVLFGLTLLGVAVFHQHTLRVALIGLAAIVIYKILFTGFKTGTGAAGFIAHVGHEWVILANLLCLLMGFALLSSHFEKSLVPEVLPKILPHDWKGAFLMLVMVWVLSILPSRAVESAPKQKSPRAFRGAIFLLSLVLCASMMPVEKLPAASWQTALGLGFLSSVFDNIPLTALAIKQGGYDWGFLAYAVGFGGSMIWFGSSAGVAISNMYPDARSVGKWLRHGWYVAVAYVIGFFAMLAVWNWHPDAPHPLKAEATAQLITK